MQWPVIVILWSFALMIAGFALMVVWSTICVIVEETVSTWSILKDGRKKE